MIDPNGKVQLRLIPAGTLTGVEEVPTYDVLPGILAKRRNNRGLEGIAAASDGTLYAIIEQLNPAGLASFGIVPVSKTVIINSITAIDPLLEKVEGVCVIGNTIVLTYDNDFNVAEAASIPANPNPNGPLVQLELVGSNYPKVFTVPMP